MAVDIAERERAALAELVKYRDRLADEVEALNRKLKLVEASIRAITTGNTSSLEEATAARAGSYASLPAQEAVERFLRENPKTTFTAREVAEGLERHGFVPRSRNFKSQVGAALNRLATKKRVAVRSKSREEGVFVYRLSPPQVLP